MTSNSHVKLDPARDGDVTVKFMPDRDEAVLGNSTDHPPQSRRDRAFSTLEKILVILCAFLVVLCIVLLVLRIYDTSFRDKNSDPNIVTINGTQYCASKYCISVAAELMGRIDENIDPCDDFFEYACGTWNRLNPIPDDKSYINIFEKMADDLNVVLQGVFEKEKPVTGGRSEVVAKALFKSCIDKDLGFIQKDVMFRVCGVIVEAIEAEGDTKFREILESHGGLIWKGKEEEINLEKLLGTLRRLYEMRIFFEAIVTVDDKNSQNNIIQVDQAEFGMPDRDYYIDGHLGNQSTAQQAYRSMIRNIYTLIGVEPKEAQKSAKEIFEFEAALAEGALSSDSRHDPSARYENLPLDKLQEAVPQFNWTTYLQTMMGPLQLKKDEPIVLLGMTYLQNFGKLMTKFKKSTIFKYVMWRFTQILLDHLPRKYKEIDSRFKKVVYGVSRPRMGPKECLDYIRTHLPNVVGAMYVREYFQDDSKDTALDMVEIIRKSFLKLIDDSSWMDERTKHVAKEKAIVMTQKIAYPDFILNNTVLDGLLPDYAFNPKKYFDNVLTINKFTSELDLKKLRDPVDRDAWLQSPAVVNAFYDPNKNDMVLPAGILQPMFYSGKSPKSLNFGGIGVVIGHEITHGFDDNGRQYDKQGNLIQWWANDTINMFRQRTQCVVDQYSSYHVPQINKTLNGRLTQGENIADNGGIKAAFKAYRQWVADNGEEPNLLGIGLTHNQLFFLNFAQIWCGKRTVEATRLAISTSVHSPSEFRVLGALSNSEDFAEAYNCKKGTRMNPVNKCVVW